MQNKFICIATVGIFIFSNEDLSASMYTGEDAFLKLVETGDYKKVHEESSFIDKNEKKRIAILNKALKLVPEAKDNVFELTQELLEALVDQAESDSEITAVYSSDYKDAAIYKFAQKIHKQPNDKYKRAIRILLGYEPIITKDEIAKKYKKPISEIKDEDVAIFHLDKNKIKSLSSTSGYNVLSAAVDSKCQFLVQMLVISPSFKNVFLNPSKDKKSTIYKLIEWRHNVEKYLGGHQDLINHLLNSAFQKKVKLSNDVKDINTGKFTKQKSAGKLLQEYKAIVGY